MGAHAAGAAELLGDRELVTSVLKDYRTAPISEAEKALYGFLEKVNRESNRIRAADVEQVRAAGWPEEAIYDALTICALFNFYNRWCDAAGVHDMSGFGYETVGKRIATQGYASSVPPGT